MESSYVSGSPLDIECDLLVICVPGDPAKDALFKAADLALGGHLSERARAEEMTGKSGQALVTHRHGGLKAHALAVIGADRAGFDAARFRDLGGSAIRVARRLGANRVVLALPQVPPKLTADAVRLATEGLLLGSYRFVKYRAEEAKKADPVQTVALTTDRSKAGTKAKPSAAVSKAMAAAFHRARVTADAICHARDMINEPPAAMTPVEVANQARELAKRHGLELKVLGPKDCEKLGMGMLLAVGQGSDQEIRLVHLIYKPKKKPTKKVAIIGKGITFDSGGYSLKPSESMFDMKVDMSGAAAVLCSMAAVAQLGSPYEIHAIAPCAENLVSGGAYKLGDVLRAMDGTTVEINNTDAEGRLALGDAITYARDKVQPDEMLDFATLTGACQVALGTATAGVMSDHDPLVNRFLRAAAAAGEDMWRLPLPPRLKEQLKSPIADLRNTGERWGGALTAGLFLKHFAKDTPWVHVDIAGPATSARDGAAVSRGGVGFAVATLLEFLVSP